MAKGWRYACRRTGKIPVTAVPSDKIPTIASLRAKNDRLADGLSTDAATRVRRALSWLERARRETDDDDSAFIFYWIAFSAVRAESGEAQVSQFEEFFQTAARADKRNAIHETVLSEDVFYTVLDLVANPYVFEPFWDYYGGGSASADEWQDALIRSVESASVHIENGETHKGLAIAFERLQVVSRQLLGGEATWGRYVNRNQVENGAKILSSLVPILIDLTLDNPDMIDRPSRYPSVESDTHEIVEDVEDYALAVNVLRRVDIGQERVYSSEDVRRELGLDD